MDSQLFTVYTGAEPIWVIVVTDGEFHLAFVHNHPEFRLKCENVLDGVYELSVFYDDLANYLQNSGCGEATVHNYRMIGDNLWKAYSASMH